MRYRYKKIKNLVEEIIEPSIQLIKNSHKKRNMPYKEIGIILEVFFPRTKYKPGGSGFFKHVFIIHSDKRILVLKVGRAKKDIRKDFDTYWKKIPSGIKNRYFAKIYWRSSGGLVMLQKYGKKRKIPEQILQKLKNIGQKYGLTDIKEKNVMKFENGFKIIDAERSKKR